MKGRTSSALAAALILSFAATSCSDSSPTDGGDPVATTSVQVRDSFFSPAANIVSPGAEVTWTWTNAALPHTLTWVDGGRENASTRQFGSFTLSMPSEAGEYRYYCSVHGSPTSGMRGRVIVE
jgi:plastocyanin